MLLKLKPTASRQQISKCLCCLIGVLGFNTVSYSQQPINQQPTPTYQNPIYQGPVYRAPPYQGPVFYPNQGRVIQQQPLPATPIYRAPRGQIETVPPVAIQIPQSNQPTPAQKPTPQQIDADQAAYNAEKLALVEKLLEKYKIAAAANRGVVEQLESLKQEKTQLLSKMSELNQATTDYQTEVASLKEQLSAAEQLSPAVTRQAEQLQANYQQAINQVTDLESKIKQLEDENSSSLAQIASLEAAQKKAMSSIPLESNQTELIQENQQLVAGNQALEQKNRRLSEEHSELEGRLRDLIQQQQLATDNNKTLNNKIAELQASNNSFDAGRVPEVAAINADTAGSPPTAERPLPPVDLSSYEAEISQLTRSNRQLSEANTGFKDKNRSLNRQLASLESQSNDQALADKASVIAATALPAVLPKTANSAALVESNTGWGILTWLIPFLAIGLGIAFFVIVKEELDRPSAEAKKSPASKD